MYTVYDFINSTVDVKHLRFGWRIEMIPTGLSCGSEIALRYTCINFDWNSLTYLNNELYNMFLTSSSYKYMKEKFNCAMIKHKRLYFAAFSIEELKYLVEKYNIKVNIDKLIESSIRKRSEKIKNKLKDSKI